MAREEREQAKTETVQTELLSFVHFTSFVPFYYIPFALCFLSVQFDPDGASKEYDQAGMVLWEQAGQMPDMSDRAFEVDWLISNTNFTYSNIDRFHNYGITLKTNMTRAYNAMLLVPPSDLPAVPAEARNATADPALDWNFANAFKVLMVECIKMTLQINQELGRIDSLRRDVEEDQELDPRFDGVTSEYFKVMRERRREVGIEASVYLHWANTFGPRLDVLRPGLKAMGLDWEPSDAVLRWDHPIEA